MTIKQHQYISRASRLLIYAIKWLEKATGEELPDKEKKRLLRAKDLLKKAQEKLF